MSEGLEHLPPELKQTLLGFLREDGDGFEVTNMMGLVNFIVEHGANCPVLYKLININEEAVIDHYKRIGEVPSGIKLIHKTQESDKVTRLEVLRGPIPAKKQCGTAA